MAELRKATKIAVTERVPRKEDIADTEKRSRAFAQLAAMKMAGPEEGKFVDNNAINFDKIDALLEDGSEISGLSDLGSSSTVERKKERKGVDSRHRRILYDACKLSLSKVPGSLCLENGINRASISWTLKVTFSWVSKQRKASQRMLGIISSVLHWWNLCGPARRR